jgi:hypothetical protein
MPHCLKCKSQRVTKGSIVNYESEQLAVFRPQGLRFLSFTLTQGPQLAEDGFACLDCGLVWSSTAPDKLASFIRKHCDQTSDT